MADSNVEKSGGAINSKQYVHFSCNAVPVCFEEHAGLSRSGEMPKKKWKYDDTTYCGLTDQEVKNISDSECMSEE